MGIDQRVEGIPRDYDEMFHKYGGLIANEIRRHNVVAANFEDHYQSVCEKVIAAQVLLKFKQRVMACTDDDKPETMTAMEACELLSITFGAWRSKQWSFHKVFVKDMKRKVPQRGKTHGTIVRNGKDISWNAWMPTPVSGGYGSRDAVYKTSDVLDVPDQGYVGKNGKFIGYFRNLKFEAASWPRRKVQPHHFVAYLLRAVRNHFSNTCRTIMRRHKDRPGDCFPQFKAPDGEYNTNWEDGLPDPTALGAFQTVDAAHDLAQTFDDGAIDNACVMTSEQKGEISALLQTHTIVEAVKMAASLTSAQKQTLLGIAEG